MADTSQQRTHRADVDYGAPPGMSGWTGWVIFAAVMLMVMGGFHIIEGFVALFQKHYYVVSPSGLVVHMSYTGWGWTHIILGAVAILIGLGLMAGNMAARVGAIIIAVISALANMAFLAAYPVWSTILIAFDVLVIYAVSVHGRELKEPSA